MNYIIFLLVLAAFASALPDRPSEVDWESIEEIIRGSKSNLTTTSDEVKAITREANVVIGFIVARRLDRLVRDSEKVYSFLQRRVVDQELTVMETQLNYRKLEVLLKHAAAKISNDVNHLSLETIKLIAKKLALLILNTNEDRKEVVELLKGE